MSSNPIQIRLNTPSTDGFTYEICNRQIYSNTIIPPLSAFEIDVPNPIKHTSEIETLKSEPGGDIIFEGPSELAGKQRSITCLRLDDGFIIKVPHIGKFQIAENGSSINELKHHYQVSTAAEFEEVLLGPPLMLTLAIQGLFALHASAVMNNNKAVLFVGESGFGKSTMARWLNELTPMKRISDDISVLELTSKQFRLQSSFPQMKLPDHEQQVQTLAIDLAAIVLLQRQTNIPAQLIPHDGLDAVQILLNHSVASQLFDSQIAQQHLKFMADLAKNVSVYSLKYPQGQENIPTIAKILSEEIN